MSHCFRLIFSNLIIQQWIYGELSFIICFDLLYLRLLYSHDPGCKSERLTQVNQSWLNMFSFQYFKKKKDVVLDYFESNYIFINRSQVIFSLVESIGSYQFNSHFLFVFEIWISWNYICWINILSYIHAYIMNSITLRNWNVLFQWKEHDTK